MVFISRGSSSFLASERPAIIPPLDCSGNVDKQTSITGKISGIVYGNNTNGYSQDSDLAAAAVHAGLLAVGEYATIEQYSWSNYSPYIGTTANGITSKNYQKASCGYKLRKINTPPPNPCSGTQEGIFTVTGRTSGGVMKGCNPFVQGSDLGMAAVTAGLLEPGQTGLIKVYDVKPYPSYLSYWGPYGTVNSYTYEDDGRCGFRIRKGEPPSDPPRYKLSAVCSPDTPIKEFVPSKGAAYRFFTDAPPGTRSIFPPPPSTYVCTCETIPLNLNGDDGLQIDRPENYPGNSGVYRPDTRFPGNNGETIGGAGGLGDDGYWKLLLPFDVDYFNYIYGPGNSIDFTGSTDFSTKHIFVGTNQYITFDGGSTVSGPVGQDKITYQTPGLWKIMIDASDGCAFKIAWGTRNDTRTAGPKFVIRLYCSSNPWWKPGSGDPYNYLDARLTKIWEIHFFKNKPKEFEIHVEKNDEYQASLVNLSNEYNPEALDEYIPIPKPN